MYTPLPIPTAWGFWFKFIYRANADRAVLGGPLFLLSQVAPSFTSRFRVLSGLTSLTWASDSAVALPPLCDYIIAQKCWNVKHFFQLFSGFCSQAPELGI